MDECKKWRMAFAIGAMLKTRRKSAGFRTKKAMAPALAEKWGVTVKTAIDYIKRIERGASIYSISSPDPGDSSQRVDDYIEMLDLEGTARAAVYCAIKELRAGIAEEGNAIKPGRDAVFGRIVAIYKKDTLMEHVKDDALRAQLIGGLERAIKQARKYRK